jgi:hypothetical protein
MQVRAARPRRGRRQLHCSATSQRQQTWKILSSSLWWVLPAHSPKDSLSMVRFVPVLGFAVSSRQNVCARSAGRVGRTQEHPD